MYSVLLVDDEKIIREGVYELLSMADLDLDLTMAASAVEAISILSERKIDIALMDICMPQMSGLELYDLILQRWPRCKMIFLTGHLEFDYVYKVHKHARYVLKAEEDEKIVEAVKESIDEIENDLLLEQAALDRSRHQHRNKYYEKTLLLRELVEGSISASFVTQEVLERLETDLMLSEPMYRIMIRSARGQRVTRDNRWMGESLGVLVEKFYLESCRGTFFAYGRNILFVLLQPRSPFPPETAVKLLEACSEVYQKAVMKNLEIPVSIYIERTPVDFSQAIGDFSSMADKLVTMTEDEIRTGSLEDGGVQSGSHIPESARRELQRSVGQLEHQFDDGNREEILNVLRTLSQELQGVTSMDDLFMLELYGSVSSSILRYGKKTDINMETARRIGLVNLYNFARYSNWGEAFGNLCRITEHIFDHVQTSLDSKNEDVINKVKSFILQNLDGDTSLYALSSHVHLCPEHLLRVFKKQEGVTILQYINDMKLAKAKQMLAHSDLPIKDIAVKLGFTSAGYFGRFFKSKQGVTPNVYRDQKRK